MVENVLAPVYASSIDGKVTIEALKRKEIEFPYCSMIQFHLLQSLKNADLEQYNVQAKKAAVYFPDILKLNWQLFLTSSKAVEPVYEEKSISPVFTPLEIVEEEQAAIHPNPLFAEPENLPIEEPTEQKEEAAPTNEDLIEKNNEPTETQEVNEPELQTENESAEAEVVGQEVKSELSDSEMAHKLALEMIANAAKQQEKPQEETIVFEPLYTKDYFASQGIKLSDESLTRDKLGKQMKSFTEWLKTMKKINNDKQPEPDEVVDKQIQMIAEKSNQTEEVVTEAMADVLLLQGKHEKAVEMYEKLSLINPAKSAYFAAIIQVIKKV